MKAGDKVVCVDSKKTPGYHEHTYPNGYLVKGLVYVISAVEQRIYSDYKGLCLFIIGKPAFWKNGSASPWPAFRFRKLDEMKEESRERYYRENPQETHIHEPQHTH